jgi:hypothetical protein
MVPSATVGRTHALPAPTGPSQVRRGASAGPASNCTGVPSAELRVFADGQWPPRSSSGSRPAPRSPPRGPQQVQPPPGEGASACSALAINRSTPPGRPVRRSEGDPIMQMQPHTHRLACSALVSVRPQSGPASEPSTTPRLRTATCCRPASEPKLLKPSTATRSSTATRGSTETRGSTATRSSPWRSERTGAATRRTVRGRQAGRPTCAAAQLVLLPVARRAGPTDAPPTPAHPARTPRGRVQAGRTAGRQLAADGRPTVIA